MKQFALILPFLLLMTACSGTSTTPPAGDVAVPASYVGLTIEQAKAKAEKDGVSFRIVMEDGTALPVTADYVIGRVSAEVMDGVVTKYTVEGTLEDQAAAGLFDQNSWKTLIPSTCASFFDGCNNCNRMEGSAEAACTRMFCETYQKPECRDEKEIEPPVGNTLTEAQARTIAEASCIKGGEALAAGFYNAGTKTWWFDANLNSVRAGCNPACVVSEETKTAEINWRCTGLVPPAASR